jgi:murein DD-endopeptidase MepM/ murein hydrolase activator NlpD
MFKAVKNISPMIFILALAAAVHAASPKAPKPGAADTARKPEVVDAAPKPEPADSASGQSAVGKPKAADTASKPKTAGRQSAASAGLDTRDALAAKQDSISEALYREEDGQDFNALFEDMDADHFMAVDTSFAWSNSRINSGRFDYKMLGPEDTIRIPLIDTAQSKHFVHPYPGHITSPFGPRRFLWHYGTDVKLHTGDTVRSMMDGIVRVIQYDRRGYGNVVVVRHHSGLETVYGHLAKGGVRVEANHHIKAGEMVGLGGNTGRSTGPHLHFEIRYFGEPFNPAYIIDFENYALRSDTLVLTRDNFEYLTEIRKTVYHAVRGGDNLGAIARRYGTTVTKLCRLNGITPRTTLRIGRKLVVRSGKEAEEQVIRDELPAAADGIDTGDTDGESAEAEVASVPAAAPDSAIIDGTAETVDAEGQ